MKTGTPEGAMNSALAVLEEAEFKVDETEV
jgi:hypothetical protein